MGLIRILDITTATAASAARPNFGNMHLRRKKVPKQPLEIYEFEGCPYCRKAREALSALSLEVVVYPCPKNGPQFREQIKSETGKSQFPYLVDPNTGVRMFESDDIVAYLFKEYGDGTVPWFMSSTFATITSSLASGMRPLSGQETKLNARTLQLRGFAFLPHRA